MSGWGHTIRPYTDEELAEWEAHEQRCAEKWPIGPYRGVLWTPCSSPKCQERPVFEATYNYVTGRAGRVSRARKVYCRTHGEKFAAKHGLTVEALS